MTSNCLWQRLAKLTVAAAVLAGPSLAAAAQDMTLAARVNGSEITRDAVQSGIDLFMRKGQLNYGGITQPKQMKKLQRQVLDQLIVQELLWQEAKREGFVATSGEVDQALEQVRASYDTELDYQQDLKRNGFTEESYREDMMHKISTRHWVQETLIPEIAVSDDEVHDYYTANEAQFVRPEQIKPRHVLIKVEPDAEEAEVAAARARIDEILAEAKAGVDFAELAKTHSEGPSAVRGGDLGFVPRGRLVGPFEDAAFALEPGKISDVVRTRFGFHIIKIEERREERVVSEQEAAPSIRNYLGNIKLQDAVEDRIATLRDEGSIEILMPLETE